MKESRFNRLYVCIFVGCFFASSSCSHADEMYFDPTLIDADSGRVADFSLLYEKGHQLPGDYLVDIYLNGKYINSRKIRFMAKEHDGKSGNHNSPKSSSVPEPAMYHDNTGLVACLHKTDFVSSDVDLLRFPKLLSLADEQCFSPENYIPQAFTHFNFEKMRLDISIPQVALKRRPHGWVPPALWDDGINAALLSYMFSGSDNDGRYGNSRSHYLNLTAGFNLAGWQLRDNSNWSDSESRFGHQRRWSHLSTYAQKAIVPLRSELTIGDATSENDVFDSLPFRGMRISTEENMYPESMRGYAPEIKGIAYSNARVSIRQNGAEIYRMFVSPGPFLINDLYPVSSGGDLNVTVTEADGSVHVFTVPYSSVPLLQRQGFLHYSVIAGRFRSTNSRYSSPGFFQATARLGLPFDITGFSGTQLSNNYRSGVFGAGVNLGSFGALSADVTHAYSTLSDGSTHQGQSIRLLYARSLVATGTSIQVAGYRYSTQGFHTLDETALNRMSGWLFDDETVDPAGKKVKQNWLNHYDLHSNRKERVQINLTQKIGESGSLFITGSNEQYWQRQYKTRMLQAGFDGHYHNVNYTISYSYSHVSAQPGSDRILFLSFSFPLSVLTHEEAADNPVWATTNSTLGNSGNVIQTGLSGTALNDGNLDWNISQGGGNKTGATGMVSATDRATYGSTSAAYSYSRDYRQLHYGISGGAILHRHGLTLAQHLGETNILVAAPGATGIPVNNGTGVQTDWRGYTVMPYASIYRENRIALDVSKLDDHTDIDDAVQRVIPTRGAIVLARFHAHAGVRALFTLTMYGKPLPFGAIATIDDHSAIVGDLGNVYFSGLKQRGVLNAKWGNGKDQHCSVNYVLSERDMHSSLVQLSKLCN